jgi:glycosyltransferase involved in cell wall biosynthesis
MPLKYSIIFPAYNEGKTIALALRETANVFDALGATYEIIVVDDGSTDDTAQRVNDLARRHERIRLIRHTQNSGKGKAVQTGVAASKGTYMLFLDCDLSTHPKTILSFLPLLQTADIIIGSRRIPGAHIISPQPWYRTWSGRIFNLVVRLYLHLPYRDTQCGFKVFHKKTKTLFTHLQTSGWVFDIELLARAQQHGFRIIEAPVEWRHGKESRVRFRDVRKIYSDIRHIHDTTLSTP